MQRAWLDGGGAADGRHEELLHLCRQKNGCEFRGGAGFGDGCFLFLFLVLGGDGEAAVAGVGSREDVGDCFGEAEFGGAVLDHGDPSDPLPEVEVGVDCIQCGEEAEDSAGSDYGGSDACQEGVGVYGSLHEDRRRFVGPDM